MQTLQLRSTQPTIGPVSKANRMRLACPSCHAAYEVPDDRLGVGARRLRCARCAHEWTFAPPTAPPPEIVPLPPLPAAPPSLVAEPLTPREPAFPPYDEPVGFAWGALAAWVASILVLAGLAFATVQFRANIMQAWPPSQRAYALIGLAPR